MKNNNKYIRVFLILLFLVGVFGSVFFFPVLLEDEYTCICHRIVEKKQDLQNLHEVNHLHYKQRLEGEFNHGLVRQYLLPFGLCWWISIGLIIFSFFLLRKKSPTLAILSTKKDAL